MIGEHCCALQAQGVCNFNLPVGNVEATNSEPGSPVAGSVGVIESDSVKLARRAEDKLHKACERASETRERTLHGQEQNRMRMAGMKESQDSDRFLVNTQVQSHALLLLYRHEVCVTSVHLLVMWRLDLIHLTLGCLLMDQYNWSLETHR